MKFEKILNMIFLILGVIMFFAAAFIWHNGFAACVYAVVILIAYWASK